MRGNPAFTLYWARHYPPAAVTRVATVEAVCHRQEHQNRVKPAIFPKKLLEINRSLKSQNRYSTRLKRYDSPSAFVGCGCITGWEHGRSERDWQQRQHWDHWSVGRCRACDQCRRDGAGRHDSAHDETPRRTALSTMTSLPHQTATNTDTSHNTMKTYSHKHRNNMAPSHNSIISAFKFWLLYNINV